jgi:hypothetical protein
MLDRGGMDVAFDLVLKAHNPLGLYEENILDFTLISLESTFKKKAIIHDFDMFIAAFGSFQSQEVL